MSQDDLIVIRDYVPSFNAVQERIQHIVIFLTQNAEMVEAYVKEFQSKIKFKISINIGGA